MGAKTKTLNKALELPKKKPPKFLDLDLTLKIPYAEFPSLKNFQKTK